MRVMKFLDRYLAGEHEAVWQELRALGTAVREPESLDDARGVATETMRRVVQNIRTLHERLTTIGYRFENPTGVHLAPASNVQQQLHEIETGPGRLPLSLEAFYQIVGSVDFRQSWDQLVQWHRKERNTATELALLGEQDPLEVSGIDDLAREAARPEVRFGLRFCFAADEFHKANYSGGENYHVSLPNEGADFQIEGMYGVEEWFIDYLRISFQYGGFRGPIVIDPQDESRAFKQVPSLSICRELAKDMIAF